MTKQNLGWIFTTLALLVAFFPEPAIGQKKKHDRKTEWKRHVGKPGPDGWRVNVIQPDPHNDGPDGFNYHDWDGDGDLDVFVNFEEGGYSRLYFNPGKEKVRGIWNDFIALEKHGKCEDSGIGDLDQDGDVDYVANGGHVYFNPGRKNVRNPAAWAKMTLFQNEARNPIVCDVDGDGLNDLVVGGKAWYKQPASNKKDAANWNRYELGDAIWPMSCFAIDMDGDGDNDFLVQERRRQGLFYYQNPGTEKIKSRWPVHVIDPHPSGMFAAYGDVNGDGLPDLVKAAEKIRIFLRKNEQGPPQYERVVVDLPEQPSSVRVKPKPKGVAIFEMNGDPSYPEIVIIPEYEAQLWYLTRVGKGKWKNTLMRMPAPETRKKMDNAFLVDLDGDGDVDVATTEENGGWGVIWFENPTLGP